MYNINSLIITRVKNINLIIYLKVCQCYTHSHLYIYMNETEFLLFFFILYSIQLTYLNASNVLLETFSFCLFIHNYGLITVINIVLFVKAYLATK